MKDNEFHPIFFFDKAKYRLCIGFDTGGLESFFFLRQGDCCYYKSDFPSDEEWNAKVKETATKLLLANKEAFDELLEKAKYGNPNREEAMLLMSVLEEA